MPQSNAILSLARPASHCCMTLDFMLSGNFEGILKCSNTIELDNIKTFFFSAVK
jgi:hypothetical protein